MKKLIFLGLISVALSYPTTALAKSSTFTLTSPVVGEMGNLPSLYTCDGLSISPPLQWTNAPKGTKFFAITMFTVPKDGPDHWYFSIWDIPAKIMKLPQGNLNIGQVGGNGENPKIGYAPPCSQGPGPKKYTFTIYALSKSTNLGSSAAKISRDDLLNAVSNITLAKSNLNVTYSRESSTSNAQPAH